MTAWPHTAALRWAPPTPRKAAGVGRSGQGELRGGGRQDDQRLGSLQSWPRGDWCPKGFADVPRGWLVSQGAC